MTTTPTTPSITASLTALCWKRAKDMPPGLRLREGTFTSETSAATLAGASRGAAPAPSVTLAYSALFPPVAGPLRGVVVFLHGINEHAGRYFHLFEELCAWGFGVLTYDLRAHGQSAMDRTDMRGHIEDFYAWVDDTRAFLAFARDELYPALGVPATTPRVLVGMSLGTLIGLHTLLRHGREFPFAGLVLTAPAIGAEFTWILRVQKLFVRLLIATVPNARLVPGVAQEWICRDPLVNGDFDADPLTTRDKMSCRTAHQLLRAIADLDAAPEVPDPKGPLVTCPLLVLMGTMDRVTSVPKAREFFARVATQDKTFAAIDGAYHALFEDYARAEVLTRLREWLEQRFAPTTAATAT